MSLPELCGLVMTATGWTPWELGEMDIDDIAPLTQHWKRYPPAHLSLAILVRSLSSDGAAAEKKPRECGPYSEDELRSFVAELNGGR